MNFGEKYASQDQTSFFSQTTSIFENSCLGSLNWNIHHCLAALLFNIYTYNLPAMISRKFAYAADLALLHSFGNCKDLEGTLSQNMSTLSAHLETWRLKLSHTKTVTAAFHLNNGEANCKLKVYNTDRLLLFCPTPTYLGVKLDRSLTIRRHLVDCAKNYPRASHC